VSSTCERIRAARERAGLGAHEVAERIGISAAHYWDLEDFEDEVSTTRRGKACE
jgi:transcriptional regulator with XRE-family HTH domain